MSNYNKSCINRSTFRRTTQSILKNTNNWLLERIIQCSWDEWLFLSQTYSFTLQEHTGIYLFFLRHHHSYSVKYEIC